MTVAKKTAAGISRTIAEHAGHAVDADVLKVIRSMHDKRDAWQAEEERWLGAMAPSAEELAMKREAALVVLGPKEREAQKLAAEASDRYKSRFLKERLLAHHLTDHHIWTTPVTGDFDLFAPPQVDHHFWWAWTEWRSSGAGINVDMLDDGVHFYGRVSYNGDPLKRFSASARSVFEITPDRLPGSASGFYNSEPKVQLFRGIDGWTGLHHPIWAADDKWCKCRLALRQSIYQVGFGGQFRMLGDRTELHVLINEENNGRAVRANLPGTMEMPALQVSPATNYSVWADLEVTFHIELEGDSFIGFSPEQNTAGSVLLLTNQWRIKPA